MASNARDLAAAAATAKAAALIRPNEHGDGGYLPGGYMPGQPTPARSGTIFGKGRTTYIVGENE